MTDEEPGKTISIEEEWMAVDQLLGRNEETAWAMAVVEAHKLFIQVLDEVSFGEGFEEKIRNAHGVFRNPTAVLAGRKVFENIVSKRDYKLTRKTARAATDDFLTGILDLIGRDFVARSWADKFFGGLGYFWGNHPRFLVWFLVALLVLVSGVWFVQDTVIGKWLAGIVVGFSRFILSKSEVFIFLVGLLVVAFGLSYWLVERRKK
jgi:hypothetical protein